MWAKDGGGCSGGRRIAKTVGDNTTKYCYDANTVQTYEYSVFGHVLGVEGAGHPNPYLFTARRLDSQTNFCAQKHHAESQTASRTLFCRSDRQKRKSQKTS